MRLFLILLVLSACALPQGAANRSAATGISGVVSRTEIVGQQQPGRRLHDVTLARAYILERNGTVVFTVRLGRRWTGGRGPPRFRQAYSGGARLDWRMAAGDQRFCLRADCTHPLLGTVRLSRTAFVAAGDGGLSVRLISGAGARDVRLPPGLFLDALARWQSDRPSAAGTG